VGQLEAMNAIYRPLEEAGADLLAISPQTAHQAYLMADQHRLRFLLLADSGNQVAQQFGLVYRVPDYQQEIYQRAFINLPLVNGESSWELPIPATFIVDRESTILYSAASPDYSDRPEPGELVHFLEQLPR
jgi:peroxiredoxin